MKKVVAQVRKERLAQVDLALRRVGVSGLTIAEEQRAGRGIWTYPVENTRHMILSVVVNDGDAGTVVSSIRESALTGSIGDGRITVGPVEAAYDIATGMPETCELESPVLGH